MRKLFTSFILSIAAIASHGQKFSKNCIPVYTNGCGTSAAQKYEIVGVQTTGGTLNISNGTAFSNAGKQSPDCGITANNYSYYTGTGKLLQVDAGTTFTLKIWADVPGASYITRNGVWIDWNHDDSFDNTTFYAPPPSINQTAELINTGVVAATVPSSSTTMQTYTVVVPKLAKHGLGRMRIRTFGTYLTSTQAAGPNPNGVNTPGGHLNPCLTNGSTAGPANNYLIVSGETEDYDIFVNNPCVKVPSVSFANITDRSADISWVPKGNEQLFEYVLDQNPGDPPPPGGYTLLKNNITSVHVPDIINKSLACNTKYFFHIRGVCDTFEGKNQALWYYGPWRTDSFVTPHCCDMPDVNISNVTSYTALASWGPVTSVQNYEYMIRIDTIPPTAGTIINNTSVTLPGLQCSKEYYFFLRALCSPTPRSEWRVDSFLTQPCLGIDNAHTMPNFNISAYPNPVKDVVTLSVMHGIKHSDADIIVTDIAGKTILHTVMTDDKINIDLRDEAPGIYLVKYADEERTQVVKINKL